MAFSSAHGTQSPGVADPTVGFLPALAFWSGADPDRLFAHILGVPYTVGALDRDSNGLAAGLRDAGIRRGDAVAVMLRNGRAALATLFALAKAGAVWVPLNVQQKGAGLRYVVEHSAPRAIIVETDLLAVLHDCGAALDGISIIAHEPGADTGLEKLLASGRPFDEPAPAGDQPFAISYTSGTTGPPKGVIVTHAMLRFAGEATALATKVRDGDVLLVWEPLYHIGGAQTVVLPLIRDVHLALVERFSASRLWDQARACGGTHVHYLGGILQILMKQPESARDRDHPVRVVWGGGCPRDIWRAFEDRFGVTVHECYGMTEASSFTTVNHTATLGSVGRAVPWLSVDVLDADGKTVPTGAQGEIVVAAKHPAALFKGYLNNPEATARALKGGRLFTGDLGSFDADGNLYFHGRMTDSMRCRGENVSAWEVERVVANYEAVEECAVIGVAADIGEQDIKLFVKPKANATIDPHELSRWLQSQLASYQVPRYYVIVDDFERTPSHRIMKGRLPRDTQNAWDRLAST